MTGSEGIDSANGFLDILASMGQVLEATDGYRQQCLAKGYSPTAAEKMAMDFHGFMLEMVLKAPNQGGAPK